LKVDFYFLHVSHLCESDCAKSIGKNAHPVNKDSASVSPEFNKLS